jgi:shikimate dehydrogenase
MPDRYAVIGNPVAHSLSPQIHAAFARQTGQAIDYGRVLAPLAAFAECVRNFSAQGGKGVNVTLPFKLEAFRLATRATARAENAQAANTLKFDDGAIFGDNTDGVGLVRDLEANLGLALAGKRVLLMGAGGAASGVLLPLLDRALAVLTVANRTLDKAQLLVQRVALPGICTACTFAQLAGQQFDVVINATSASVSGEEVALPPRLFAADSLAYDMMYGAGATPFMQAAQSQGASRTADGLGMLVEQAAESFFIWRGVRPETAPVIAALKAQR